MPSVLYVQSPNGQQRCAGQYNLLPEPINGRPLWQQVHGDFWIYSGHNGMWIVGGDDAKEKNFQCNHGVLFCKTLHNGSSPEKVSGSWWRLDKDNFVEDEEIRVTTGIAAPSALRLVSPNGQQRCAGEYNIVAGEFANGLPIWRQKTGKCWLYSGTNAHWIVGGTDAKEKEFKCAKGVIYSKNPHGGLLPDRLGCVWMRLHDSDFNEDSAIHVAVKPLPLYVSSPNGQQRCAGEFTPVADRMANGQPLWQHIGGKCWLYSGSNGMWIIGGADAMEKKFQTTRGVIYCKTAHGGLMPDKMVGNWLRLDGEQFREDVALSVSVKPSTLYLVAPLGQQRCAGEYRLAPGENANGQPVWKQRKGICRIFSSRKGMWQIAGNESKESDYQHAQPFLQCDVEHKGEMPDKVGGLWSRLDVEDLYNKDEAVKVTTVLHKPAKLHVKSPKGQQRCAGEYVLVTTMTANGQPLWRQMGGKYWLYSGTNGMWIFGSSGAKEKNFECSRGVIYSNTPHGGIMPDKMNSVWLRLEKEAFHEDPEITVDGDHSTRKRAAPG